MNYKPEGFVKIGMWSNTTRLVDDNTEKSSWIARKDVMFIGELSSAPTGFGKSLSGCHLKVGVIEEAPIAFLDENCSVTEQSSPECWYGWNPDLIKRLAKDLKFTYEFIKEGSKIYGGFNDDNNSWNGLVGEIIDSSIDLTVALSINTKRSKYIGFSAPFYEDQASMALFTKSSKSSTNMFFFLEPFELSVWLTILGLIVVVGVLMTLLNKLSPLVCFGKKVDELKTCLECGLREQLKLKAADTKEQEAMGRVAGVAENRVDDLTFNNSTWLIGTGGAHRINN